MSARRAAVVVFATAPGRSPGDAAAWVESAVRDALCRGHGVEMPIELPVRGRDQVVEVVGVYPASSLGDGLVTVSPTGRAWMLAGVDDPDALPLGDPERSDLVEAERRGAVTALEMLLTAVFLGPQVEVCVRSLQARIGSGELVL